MSVHQKTAQHSQPCRDHQRGSRPRRLSPCSVGLRPPSQGERRRLSHPDCRCAASVRSWEKTIDEQLHPACAELTFVCCHRHIVLRLGEKGLLEFLSSTPDQSVTSTWRERKKEIVRLWFEAPRNEDTIRLYDTCLKKMDEALRQQSWLAGESFSLADIGLTPYVNRLDMLSMSGMWSGGRLLHLETWFHRIKEMKSFVPSFIDWCPAELTNDFKTFGAQSWPDVRRIIGLS